MFSFVFSLPIARFSAPISKTEALKIIHSTDKVEHLFTHCLIAHPEIAFQVGNPYGKHLDRDCLTATEFRRILQALYENNYALVDIYSTFSGNGLTARRIDFTFPKDKKPLVLSFDDVVYAEKNKGKGMCDKLILGENEEILAYTENAKTTAHKEEFVPILEDFIEKHPDFSYNGARGILFLTGFDGILGYRTQRTSTNRQTEIEKVKPLVQTLKKKGWIFGSHSYSHGHMRKYTPEQMQNDVEKWQKEVEPLVGKTSLYAYPYGEWVIGENCSDLRAKTLLNAGFSLFFGVGSSPYYVKMPLSSDEKLLFQDRCAMDGVSLRAGYCDRFFNSREIYDNLRPISHPLL